MIGEDFIRRDKKPMWWYVAGICIPVLFAVGCWMQTGLFVPVYASFFASDSTSYPSLQEHMAQSRAMQANLASKVGKKESNEKIQYVKFAESEKISLEAARKFILSDDELDQKLKERFGTSLREAEAVVAPSWKIDYPEDIGITDGGWSDFKESADSSSVGGMTIRDKPGVSQRTLDGTPRIVLNPNALAYGESWTRRVVFHEMMHAMNLPAYKPFLARTQTDLTYLPEYCWFVGKAKLGIFSERLCRTLVGFSMLTCLVNLSLFVGYHRRQT